MTTNNNNASSLQFAAYLDVANDVKPWCQVPTNDTTRDAQLQLLTEMSCQWVQKYLGRPIAPQTFTKRFDGWSGWNGAYLELPYYPVLEVTAVTEWWGSSGGHVLSEQTPDNQVDGWQCEYLTGRLTRVFPGLVQKPWFPGSRNIEVTWTAGYQPVPPDIRVATLELTAWWFRNSQQASVSIRPGTDFGADAEEKNGLWTGVPFRIIDLLEPYVQQGIG